MRLSVLATAGVFAAAALGAKTKSSKKCSRHCFNAIVSDTPASIGEAFCSSFLSLEPLDTLTATVTVAHDETVTTTNTNTEVTTTTVTTTGATLTTTTGTVTVFAKRAQPSSDPSASILFVCKTNSARISSICSYLLPPATAPTSTLTVDQTSTSASVVEYTTTSVETLTETATTTAYAVATDTVTLGIINGDFEGPDISPWTFVAGPGTGPITGRIDHFKGGNVCVDVGGTGNINCYVSSVVRVVPPSNSYASIVQTFQALPDTTYTLSFLLTAGFDPPADGSNPLSLQAFYQGFSIGSHALNTPQITYYFYLLGMWEFTTDSTGAGTLEIRVGNSGSDQVEYYLDDIMVVKQA